MTKIIATALIAIAFALAGAWAYAEIADADGMLEGGRRVDCIPRDHANPTGPCLWTPELTKVEVKVEFEYPYCEVKLTVENNLDELPEGVGIKVGRFWHYENKPYANLIYIQPDGVSRPLSSKSARNQYGNRWTPFGIGHYNAGVAAHHPNWVTNIKYKSDGNRFHELTRKVVENLPQTTLGKVYMQIHLEYSGEFTKPRRVGNAVKTHSQVSPQVVQTNAIPISHTFVGLFDEMVTCLEVAKREEDRVSERVELEAQKAGLRQSLALLESELARARQHELDATTILKEVIDVSERVDEVLRTIQRVRIDGLAERRKLIERYYSDESQRYSVFIRSLEASQTALAAADESIAAHKAELEKSRAALERIVTDAQAAEAALITEIEEAREALGDAGE